MLAKSRHYEELHDAWKGWHDQARALRRDNVRVTELANAGAQTLGYKDLGAMLEKGASQPWQDTMYELTGTRQMDAAAIIDYFKPLQGWLQQQNKGQTCGW